MPSLFLKSVAVEAGATSFAGAHEAPSANTPRVSLAQTPASYGASLPHGRTPLSALPLGSCAKLAPTGSPLLQTLRPRVERKSAVTLAETYGVEAGTSRAPRVAAWPVFTKDTRGVKHTGADAA